MNFTLITALLCTFSRLSVSEFHAVEVQPGGEVTLTCSNFTSLPLHIFWFRLANRSNVSCISSMWDADTNASFCEGFQNAKFNMASNTTTLFLKIKQVDLSDSGLYFCGLRSAGNSIIFSATYLKVHDTFDGRMNLISVILGALTAFLFTVVIGLVVKIRKLHTAHKEGRNPQRSEILGSGDLNYAALTFQPKAESNRGHAAENQLEPNVVYAATR